MEKREFLRMAILDLICNDFENIDQTIWADAQELALPLGLNVDRTEVVATLSELLEEGLAAAWILSAQPPHETRCGEMPKVNDIETDFRTYFLITDAGIKLLLKSGGSLLPPKQSEVIENYKAAFEGFSEDEMAILDGIILK